MAEIKGFTIKNVKKFKGHEMEDCTQGSIFYKDKKVGYYSDSFNMGAAEYRFDDRTFEKQAEEIAKQYFTEHPESLYFEKHKPDFEDFMVQIISLLEEEKIYKKYLKQGYNFVASYKNKANESIMAAFKFKQNLDKKIQDEQLTEVRIYQSLNDFIIA